MNEKRIVSMFAGIGGFELAFNKAMNNTHNHSIKALTIKDLRALFIDLSSKQWTAYIFNDGIKHEEGTWHNGTDQQNYQRIKELIERLKVNYVVYERREIDRIPERPNEQDGFIRYIRLTHFLVNYSHRHNIAGTAILPGEVNKYIERETNWCGRDPFLKKPRYCDRHKAEAPCENGYNDRDIPIKDEVDARAMYEIGEYRRFIKDIEGLKERERIHEAPPKSETRQNNQYEKDKWQRLGTTRNNIIASKEIIKENTTEKQAQHNLYTSNKNQAKT